MSNSIILGMLAETSIHAGAEGTVGVIDLPIQREVHTDYPCVHGSGLKGALRAKARQTWTETPADVVDLFGPDTGPGDDKHAGALDISDARLLLLPVRSLTSHFKWVTCHAVLERLDRDQRRLGAGAIDTALLTLSKGVGVGEALVHTGSVAGALFLEEFRFTSKPVDLAKLVVTLGELMPGSAAARLPQQLTIVHDDRFAHLARYCTAVAAHVRLNERKTTEDGALWYEESLPPDTMMYAWLLPNASRMQVDHARTLQAVAQRAKELFAGNPYLQVGGNETTGMGWFNLVARAMGA